MDREIKFRVWHDGKMSYTDRSNMEVYFDNTPWDTSVYGELMQFTGLKDENGKDIYEGDIVHVLEYMNGKIWEGHLHLATVEFINGKFDINPAWCHQSLQKNSVTIVGNIFENPELIKS